MIKFAEVGIEDPRIQKAVLKVLKSGQFIGGKQVMRFEKEFAKFCGAKYCASVASGSAALVTALKVLSKMSNSKPGFKVIVPSMSFAATALSVREAGGVPVYCDVDSRGLLDQDRCLELLNYYKGAIMAVIPVHLYGQIMKLKPEMLNQVAVVEDACQAAGSFTELQGDIACFSFYPTKNLGAAGDAGAIISNDREMYLEAKAYVNYGDYPGEKYKHSVMGTNARMDAIQAAILRVKLETLTEADYVRKIMVGDYNTLGIHSMAANPSSWHLYPILVDDVNKFRYILEEAGIQTGNHYPYRLPDVVAGCDDTTTNDKSYSIVWNVVTLPIGSHLTYANIQTISSQIKSIAEYTNLVWRVQI